MLPRANWLAATVLVLLLLLEQASAQSTPYTVQVVALSDYESALRVQTDLIRDGYPAYVVRSVSNQGDLFRVRVGAFANRGAALLYAAGMPQVEGGQPVPALAEGIPFGIMPLAPLLLVQEAFADRDVRLLPMPGVLALRIQELEPLQEATYLLLGRGSAQRLRAWQLGVLALPATEPAGEAETPQGQAEDGPPGTSEAGAAEEGAAEPETSETDATQSDATETDATETDATETDATESNATETDPPESDAAPAPVGDGLVWVREVPLWPDSWRTDSNEVRDGFMATLVALTAERLGVPQAEVLAAVFRRSEESEPRLVVVERFDPVAGAGELLGLGFAPAGFSAAGPLDYLRFDPSRLPGITAGPNLEALLDAPAVVVGNGWEAVADGAYIRLTLTAEVEAGAAAGAAVGTTWRASLGTPLWTDGNLLIALLDGELLVYDFVPR